MKSYKRIYIVLVLIVLTTKIVLAQQSEISLAIQQKIEIGIEHGGLTVDDIFLFNHDSLIVFYTERKFLPIWADEKNREDFITVISGAWDEGLNPNDYHVDRLKALVEKVRQGNASPDVYAIIDLLMSDAISLYINHMNYGKVMQSKLRKSWDIAENPMPSDPTTDFLVALKNKSLLDFFSHFGPQHFMYRHLKSGLKKYRAIQEHGGWSPIDEGETLKLGMTSDKISQMRDRLILCGDLKETNNPKPDLYDEVLEMAVKQFQFRNNLNSDGAAGKKTIAAMNVPVNDRIDQIRVNMERARWVMHELEEDFLVVNIAGYNMRRVTNDSVVYFSPVIVGKPYHQSPVFKATLQYFVINPTWTIPYSIATRETLPKLQKDPDYLSKHNMVIMDRGGKILDPSSINFEEYSRNNFPFTVRQEPGPHNALGEVKFIFPNSHSVYVHDTPARGLFSREERAFSHGCIRLQNKWELLMSVMDEPEVWNMEKINQILDSEKTTTVHLKNPIDILILYWTAGADKKDRIYFNPDIYKRDAAVLKALDTPWEYKKVN